MPRPRPLIPARVPDTLLSALCVTLLLALLLGVPGLLGCSTTAGSAPLEFPIDTEPDLTDPRFGVFVPDRVDAVLGERLVIPVELAGAFSPEDVGGVRLDDGRFVSTRLVWLSRTATPLQQRTWLPTADAMMPIDAGQPGAGAGAGSWVLLIDPPVDAVGQGIWLAGRRVVLSWLPDPQEVALRVPGVAWSSPLSAGVRRSASLQSMLGPLRDDPVRRWRARFVSGELAPSSQARIVDADGVLRRADEPTVPAADSFADDTLEAIARLNEARWLIGLARLYSTDSELSLAVRQRLASAVDFGDGALAPVWDTGGESLARLLMDLLDQSLSPRERARRVAGWLDDQPTHASWILSDGGRRTIRGEPMTTLGFANAAWSPLVVGVESWEAAQPLDVAPVPALTARPVEVVSRPVGASRAGVIATAGGEEIALLASGADAAATPPGLRIESLVHELTLSELLSRRRSTPRIDATAALVYRDHRDRWVLYVECRTENRLPGDRDTLTISLAPDGSDSAQTIVANAEGEIEVWTAHDPAGEVEAEIGRYEGGWSLRVPIPEAVIERGRTLRVGLQRVTDRGVRSSWPRAMLPWQASPPKAAIDLSVWDG
ncbi:MAG: hypothetical protein AAFR96_03005 [Planctomycetota bacterium]